MSRRVLIAHDDPQSSALLAAMLAPLKHELVAVDRAEHALVELAREAPDLVLLSVEMAGFEHDPCGRDVLARLRPADARAYVPVIALVGQADREGWIAALDAGADAVLDAPYDRSLLHATLRSLLTRKDRVDALRGRNDALVEEQRDRRMAMRGLVHDLRTPLMIAQASIAYAARNLGGAAPATSTALSDAADGIADTAELVNRLVRAAGIEPSSRGANDPLGSPSHAAPDTTLARESAPIRRPTSERVRTGIARTYRVLVVDDIDASRRALRDLLSDEMHAVTLASSAREALLLLQLEAFDAVLMDVDMPEMDGIAATRAIHATPSARHVPVIAITGHALVGDLERALAAGCVGYVAKPVGRAELTSAIATAVESARAAEARADQV